MPRVTMELETEEMREFGQQRVPQFWVPSEHLEERKPQKLWQPRTVQEPE
jgi:hypothetical protein